ncbi:hypothetical protein R1flu_012706 [Riccia fluitans]|uniref:RING-type domain-containing protein n=1 Tax=Riccia fluitans TaxID=41844 RepID=A0ABD1ZBD4_9MARC
MAVQAQCPSNMLVSHFQNSMRQNFGGENRNFLAPGSYQPNSFTDEFHLHNDGNGAGNQMRLFTSLGIPNQSHQPTINPSVYREPANELACSLLGSRKRPREADEFLSNNKGQLMMVAEFHQNHGSGSVILPQSNSVSTGLRLAFEDDPLNSESSPSTSGRSEVTSLLFSVGEELSSHLVQQKEEIDQLFKTQTEQASQFLQEKRLRHSRALISAVQEGVSRKLREKDLEVEKVKRRNAELEEHARKVNLELHFVQNKLKTCEAQVLTLRSNLQQAQQAVQLSREQSKEGCGDSEADDAASSHHGDLGDAQARSFRKNKELKEQRTCRVCRTNDVCMLLLPCRHLCLCKDCEGRLTNCPLCQSPKNASLQIYMS